MLVEFIPVATCVRYRPGPFQRFSAVLLLAALCAGSTVGTGNRTVIRAQTEDATLAAKFPFFLTASPTESDRILIAQGPKPRSLGVGRSLFAGSTAANRIARRTSFNAYMSQKYGDPNFDSASLSITVRDLGRLPPLAPDLTTFLRQEISKIQADGKLSDEERRSRIDELRAIMLNAPELQYSTTLHRIDENGREIYYYFPRLQVDFTADLLTRLWIDSANL